MTPNSLSQNNDHCNEEMEIIISQILQIGVSFSAGIILLGLLMFIITGHSGYPQGYLPTSIGEIITGFPLLKSFAVILTGLFLLILTPIFRVGVSIILFLKEKNYLYVVFSTFVLIVLLIALIFNFNF